MQSRPRPPEPADPSLLLDTAFGPCRITWSDRGLTSVHLLSERPDPAPGGAPDQPPAFVQDAAERLARHLAGEPQDLTAIPLDLERVSPFHRRIYEAARRVGPGRTVSYGELAAALGAPGAARAVGQAMARNPFVIVVPCHRVLAAGGGAGGFSAPGGLDTKARLLALEGAEGAAAAARRAAPAGATQLALPLDQASGRGPT